MALALFGKLLDGHFLDFAQLAKLGTELVFNGHTSSCTNGSEKP